MKKHTRSGMGRTERRKAKLKEAKRLEEQEIYKKKKEEEAEEQKKLEEKYLHPDHKLEGNNDTPDS